MLRNAGEDKKLGKAWRWDYQESWQGIRLFEKHHWWAEIKRKANHQQSWECSRVLASSQGFY
jgi:hypothetical protein